MTRKRRLKRLCSARGFVVAVDYKTKLYVREAGCVRRQDKPAPVKRVSQSSEQENFDFDTPVVRHRKYSLEELLAGITPENLHPETNTGHSVGREF